MRQDYHSFISQLIADKPMKMWLQESDAFGAADKRNSNTLTTCVKPFTDNVSQSNKAATLVVYT